MTIAASRFRAMSTDVALLAPGAGSDFERAAAIVRRVFWEVERSLSRFLPDSDLSRLNRSGGTPVQVSPFLYMVVSLALRAASETDGIFDPTVLAALEHAGYDRSFDQVIARGSSPRPTSPAGSQPDYRAIRCDPRTRIIALGCGQRLDLGGIGKGLAVDLALAETSFLRDRCIVAGGDGAARGAAGPDGAWTIAVEDTGHDGPRSIGLHDAAVATSTTLKRRWRMADQEGHHLIDPRTAQPSASPLRSVTVVAASCVQADVMAKTALLLGEQGLALLESRGLHGLAVRHDGSTVSTRRWPATEEGT